MKSNFRTAGVALVAAFALAACADETPDGTAATSPTESVSATPTPTPTTSPTPTVARPVMPVAATKHTNQGAEAFTRYAATVVNHAYSSGDFQALSRISTSDCIACTRMTGLISSTYAAGGHYDGGELSIKSIWFTGISSDVKPTAVTTLDISELSRIGPDGQVLNVDPSTVAREFLWDLRWESGTWLIQEVRTSS